MRPKKSEPVSGPTKPLLVAADCQSISANEDGLILRTGLQSAPFDPPPWPQLNCLIADRGDPFQSEIGVGDTDTLGHGSPPAG